MSPARFYGIGLGEAIIKLDDHNEMKQLPRMSLAEYQNLISSFDVGLCLMASPHPSLLPFDLAGSGAIVVTNSFEVKNQSYFRALGTGFHRAHPLLPHGQISACVAHNILSCVRSIHGR